MKVSSKTGLKPDRQRRANSPCEFIVKLLQMMKAFPHNVKWSEDGQHVEFNDLNIIQNEASQYAFLHQTSTLKYQSQLNMYYFSKLDSDQQNVMKFKHSLFRQGNQDNFYLISRRNKTRDQIIGNIEKNYGETLAMLERDSKLSEQTKSLIKMGIEYHSISIKNLKKMKVAIEQLAEQLKTVRSKQLKRAVSKLRQQHLVEVIKLIEGYKYLDAFVKQSLCRDLTLKNIQMLPSLTSHIALFDEPGTIKEMQIHKVFNLRSECSILQFKSEECSLQRNLREKDEQVSLEEDLKQQNSNQNQI